MTKMYSQIIKVDRGSTRLYINTSKEEHDGVCRALIEEGFKHSSQIKKLTDKVFDVWYLYQEER